MLHERSNSNKVLEPINPTSTTDGGRINILNAVNFKGGIDGAPAKYVPTINGETKWHRKNRRIHLTSGANVVYTAPTDTYAVASINICNLNLQRPIRIAELPADTSQQVNILNLIQRYFQKVYLKELYSINSRTKNCMLRSRHFSSGY